MQRKYLVKAVIFILLFLVLVWGRVFFLQRGHFLAAETYYHDADWKLAIREYDTAMHFYTPFSPYIQKSAERLWDIGETFEKQQRLDWAVVAYSSIRSAFYGSRSFYTPGHDWIVRCDDKISGIDVKILIKEGNVKPGEALQEKEKLLYVMKVDKAPNIGWSVLAELTFFGWILSVIFIIFRGFDEDGRIKRKFFYGSIYFVLTFTFWIVCLLKA
jgi:hypothetical protein